MQCGRHHTGGPRSVRCKDAARENAIAALWPEAVCQSHTLGAVGAMGPWAHSSFDGGQLAILEWSLDRVNHGVPLLWA